MRTAFVAIVSLLLLAACGGAPAAPTAGAPTDMPAGPSPAPAVTSAPASPAGEGATPDAAPAGALCHLVTVDEVEAATGLQVDMAEEMGGGCRWLLKGADGGDAGIVALSRDTRQSIDLTEFRTLFNGEDVAGVGADAVWVPMGNILHFVHDGNAYLAQVGIYGGDPASIDMARAIALAAISRL